MNLNPSEISDLIKSRIQNMQLAATARNSTPEKINEVAQGRVWTGQQAKAHGLIDDLGGLQEALSRVRTAPPPGRGAGSVSVRLKLTDDPPS